MKKKGFTLIELLAVIVVLAIIALIAVPLVLNIIEKARKEAFKNSIYNLERAAELYTVKSDYNKDEKLEFICDGKTCETSDGKKLDIKGDIPTGGSVIIEDGKVTIEYIKNENYCVIGTKEDLKIEKECYQLDTTASELSIEKSKVSSNSIMVRIIASDEESGIKKIEYVINNKTKGIEDKKSIKTVDETYLFEDLDKNTEYEIKIKATNGNNLETEKTITIKTEEIGNPSITYTNTPTDSINGYLERQVINVEFDNSNITTPTYYIKTTRKGTSSLNVTESCGTGTEPETCTSITDTTTLDINTWYKVSRDVKVTYSEPSDTVGTLYAITYDGRNYGGASTGVISKIDTAGPVISLSKTTSKTDSLIVSYSITDKVGVKNTTCKYGETVGTYDKTGSATNTSCILTGLDDDKTYYYQVCSTDMLGINGNCVTGNSKTELVNNPSITYTNTPTTSANGYLERQVINVAFNNSNITTPTYYIKTTRKGTSSLNVTASCGTGTEPGTCTNITSTNTLNTNTWYKVSGDVKVTYSEPSDIAGTLYAITYDGRNYSGASTGVISKIIEPVTGISLNHTNVTLENGSTLQLTAAISPNNATNKTVTWTSSNTGVATVDGNGLVVARGAGNAVITATTSNGKIATCTITVIISPNGISISPNGGTIKVNDTIQLYATVSPWDATNKMVTWTSNNPGIATVDGNGLVIGRGVGTATITATTYNGKSASVNITVKPPTGNYGTSIQGLYPSIYIKYGSTSRLVTQIHDYDESYTGNFAYPWTLYDMMCNNSSNCAKLDAGPYNFGSNNNTRIGSGNNYLTFLRNSSLDTWIGIRISAGGFSGYLYVSNFYLVFADGNVLTLESAVNNGYIEPLVLLSSASHNSRYLWGNVNNLINGGATAESNYPTIHVTFKVKDRSPLSGCRIYASSEFDATYDGITALEYNGVDLSATPFNN